MVPSWYTPEAEEGEAAPAQFKIQPLNGMQYLEVIGHGTATADGLFIANHLGRQLLLKHGLKGWKNIEGDDGDPLPFSVSNFDYLPPDILNELANKILTDSTLAGEARKKSSSQSKSSPTASDSTAPGVPGEDTADRAIQHP